MSRLLFSLQDITPTKNTITLVREQYFVIFGYDPAGKAEALSFEGDNILSSLSGAHAKLKQWFFMGTTPIFKIHRKQKHVFPGGLPLYDGPKTDMTSIYLAIVESDQRSRDAGKALRDFIGKIDVNPLMDAAIKLTTMAQPEAALVKAAFGLTIKALEEALIRNGDDIDYTNVFTFKKSDSFLIGTHADWGNHKLDLTFTVEERAIG